MAILKQLQTHFKAKHEKGVGTPFPRVPVPLHPCSFCCIFRGNIVLDVVSCLLGCLPELSNDNNQPSTMSCALLRHDFFRTD